MEEKFGYSNIVQLMIKYIWIMPFKTKMNKCSTKRAYCGIINI